MRERWRARWPVALVTGLAFAAYSAYSLARHRLVLTAGYDLGIFDQAVRAYSRFQAPLVALKGQDYNLLGDHFHPVLALAAPLYWIWDDPRTLLLLQAALMAASIPVVHRFAARRMPGGWALGIAIGYAIAWPMAGMIDFDFHEVAFAVPLLALALDGLDRGSDRALMGWAIPLLAVREDMGALLLMLGFVRVWRRPRWVGALLMALGAAMFLLVTKVFIPAMASDGTFAYWTFDSLGTDLGSSVKYLLTHPLDGVRLFLTPTTKLATLGFLLVPLSLLPLASPYTLVALPLLAERFWNSRELLWTTHHHYNAPIWVILVLAMIDGGTRMGVWSQPRLRALIVGWLVASQLLLVAVDPGTPPVVRRMLNGNAWRANEHTLAQREAVAQVPAGVCVAADDRLAAQLTTTNRVTLPGIPGPTPDYIVVDTTEPVPGIGLAASTEVLARAKEAGYRTVWTGQGIYVLRAPQITERAECRP